MNSLMGRASLWSIVFVIIFAFISLSTCSKQEEKVSEIKICSQMPIGHHISKAIDIFCDKANRKSNGHLVFKNFPGGQLMKDSEVPHAISTGTIEMAQTFLPWWKGIVPRVNPYSARIYDNRDHNLRVIRGPLLQYQSRLMEEKGMCKIIAPILYNSSGGYILTKPVRRVGDMKGMKIRIPSKSSAAEVRSLGGAPVVMSSADVYMALQRGTIDGAVSGITSFYDRKWHEVAKHLLILRVAMADFHIVANVKWWNNLAADLQQIIIDAARDATEYCDMQVYNKEEEAFIKLKEKGVQINQISHKEYNTSWKPIIEPALRSAALKEFGERLINQYDRWIEETKSE
ncbi:MAG: TRAP transporter substrate-binding protein [Spirochaetota bacterium]|nr:TRAP transporter substrate-binding protein [Spirochaetota bacterium]